MNNSTSATLAAAIAAISMGSIGLISRLSQTDSITVTYYRLGIGALLILLLLVITKRGSILKTRPAPLTLLGGIFISGFIFCYIEAMQHTTMAVAVITLYAAPALASLIGHFFLKDRLSRRASVSVAISIGGFLLVILGAGEQGQATAIGFSFALASMVCYCAFLLINKANSSENSNVLGNTFWQMLAGALLLLPMMLMGESSVQSPAQWGWMFLAGLIPGFIGLSLAIFAVERMRSASFAAISYLEPVTALLLGWTVFNESLSPMQILGAGIIISNSLIEAYMSRTRTQQTSLARAK